TWYSRCSLLGRPPSSALFPYTTLFRSELLFNGRLDLVDAPGHLGGTWSELAFDGSLDLVDAVGHLGCSRSDLAVEARVERGGSRSEEHTSELQSRENLVCRLLLEKKKN